MAEKLYFDPSTGLLIGAEYVEEELYFDPSTGRLGVRHVKTNERPKNTSTLRPYSCGSGGFFGGICSSALTQACNQSSTSKDFDDEVKSTSTSDSGEASLERFYKIQSLQMLGDEDDQVVVPIWIAREPNRPKYMNVAPAWIEHLQRAIKDINYAAPGLFLYITSNPLTAKVKIAGNNQDTRCFTRGNILQSTWTEIFLYSKGSLYDMKRTSCHELLHALGFQHEHQRRDRDSSLHLNWRRSPGDDWYKQYEMVAEILGLTRFDPFSILLYPEDEELSRNRGDPVWYTKPFKSLNREMSELDKVALNSVYRPCKGPQYSPIKSGATGLWYCGR